MDLRLLVHYMEPMESTAAFNMVFAASFFGCLMAIGFAMVLRKTASYQNDDDIPLWVYGAIVGICGLALLALFTGAAGPTLAPLLPQTSPPPVVSPS